MDKKAKAEDSLGQPCRGCKVSFKSLLGHIARTNKSCKEKYSSDELSQLEKQSKKLSAFKNNSKRRISYDSKKRAEKYKKLIKDDTEEIKAKGFHQHQLCKSRYINLIGNAFFCAKNKSESFI